MIITLCLLFIATCLLIDCCVIKHKTNKHIEAQMHLVDEQRAITRKASMSRSVTHDAEES